MSAMQVAPGDSLPRVSAAADEFQQSRIGKAIEIFSRRRSARCGVAGLWVILAVGGALCAKKFTAVLESDAPPVPGTASALAQDAHDKYFPAEPLSAAFLAKSRDGSMLLDFGGSTCSLAAVPAAGLGVKLACSDAEWRKQHNQSALGGGCIIKTDLAVQLREQIINITSSLLTRPPFNFNKTQLNQTQKKILSELSSKLAALPNITSCPRPTRLTADWLQLSSSLLDKVQAKLPDYHNVVTSFASLPNQTISQAFDLHDLSPSMPAGLKVTFTLELPGGELWQMFQSQLLADDYSTSLFSVQTSSKTGHPISAMSEEAKAVGDVMLGIASDEATASNALDVQASSMGIMMKTIKEGIDSTMNLSALTTPVALLILAAMVRNLRLLLITILNLITALLAAILLAYPIALKVTTATVAPALMVAVALAMSIDYSLFLLTRFQSEVSAGREVREAVIIMLSTSGRIVLVSGLTLLLCFLTMLVLPVAFIYSMGIAAALTVFMAVLVALTLTPTLLLSFPRFFSSNRCWGLSSGGCCCDRSNILDASNQVRSTGEVPDDEDALTKSCWPTFGANIQKGAWVVAIALVASAIPVAVTALPNFKHSVGVTMMMPTTADATHTLFDLQTAFGVGAVFPTQMILVPPEGATSTDEKRKAWLEQSCNALQQVARTVAPQLSSDLPEFTAEAFAGPMILNGRCITSGLGAGAGTWSNVGGNFSATMVTISYQIDPFSTEGGVWIRALRDAVKTTSVSDVATWHVFGIGPVQLDVSDVTFARLPLMSAVMMAIVFVVIGAAFQSLVAPLRAVFCLSWMLVITFGLAVYTFQDGMLSFLNCEQVGTRQAGAMSWMSPAMASAVMVGLGLDYDIFYSERVLEEWEHGHTEKDSANRALGATANTITAAGVIMVIAFSALLICHVPVLNEIAFLLIVGIIIDCFMTTKVIVPCVMALLGKINFWPRKQADATVHEGGMRNVLLDRDEQGALPSV